MSAGLTGAGNKKLMFFRWKTLVISYAWGWITFNLKRVEMTKVTKTFLTNKKEWEQ